METKNVCCGVCGTDKHRIYRPYGNFYRPADNRCNNCLEETDWYVPCIPDKEGGIWGYCAVPEDACKWFYALPEKNQYKPSWDEKHSMWTNSEMYINRNLKNET